MKATLPESLMSAVQNPAKLMSTGQVLPSGEGPPAVAIGVNWPLDSTPNTCRPWLSCIVVTNAIWPWLFIRPISKRLPMGWNPGVGTPLWAST